MNIYVGNLPTSASEESLKDLFSQFGHVVSVKLIKDKFTGALRGFAFVEMATAAEADEAINALNGSDFGGQKLRVNQARPKESRPPRHHGGGGGGRSFSNRGRM